MPSELPPGQALTRHFPIVGETAPAAGAADASRWVVEFSGLLAQPLRLTLAELLALPQQTRRIDIHCVTGWSRLGVDIVGLPLALLLDRAGVDSRAAYVRFVAHSARRHDTSLPLPLARAETWLVHSMDGVPLSAAHGGPLRTITPGRYFYKSLKWLAAVELLGEDHPGYWERESAYHNEADPWREQRFDEARVAAAEDVARLRAAMDFAPFRDQVWIKARLGGWTPATRDFSGMQLKYCSLRNARLVGADFSGANLSLSSLEGADLRGARFHASDIEGASFAGADLREASIVDSAASATRFFRDFANGKRLAARVDGLHLRGVSGLLDEQRAFLLAAGARFD